MNSLINEALSELRDFQGEKILLLSSTVNPGNSEVFRARTKIYKDQIVIHFLFKTIEYVNQVLNGLKDAVDFVAVDTETKVNDLKLDSIIKKTSLKVPVLKVKANDYTVDSLIHLINVISPDFDKISIIGCGNIGSKAALALAESGHQVSLYSRSYGKARMIVTALHAFAHCQGKNLEAIDNLTEAFSSSDIIVLAAPGTTIINDSNAMYLKNTRVIIDIGGNGIDSNLISSLLTEGKKLYSLDSAPGLFGSIFTAKMSLLKYKSQNLNKEMVPVGSLGLAGQKLYDPLTSRVIGVCDGTGGLMGFTEKEEK